ncbi:MAG TPA: hypothetical protein VGK95_09560 [Caldimonas sp.]|jgi:hypothetical protein
MQSERIRSPDGVNAKRRMPRKGDVAPAHANRSHGSVHLGEDAQSGHEVEDDRTQQREHTDHRHEPCRCDDEDAECADAVGRGAHDRAGSVESRRDERERDDDRARRALTKLEPIAVLDDLAVERLQDRPLHRKMVFRSHALGSISTFDAVARRPYSAIASARSAPASETVRV